MDEGFATYVSNYAENHVLKLGNSNPNSESYKSYFQLWDYHIEEPLTTQSDAYHYNYAYSVGSYSKGALFLAQLEYVLGKENVDKTLQRYYQKFQFKHPSPNDIKRTAEKVSGISLDWYLNYWTQTTHAIDYGVSLESPTQILLQRIGRMPMPIDLSVVYRDGTTEDFYIPLLMMRGEKPTTATRLKDWSWVAPQYRIATEKKIDSVVIDPMEMMADVDRSNNSWSSAQQISKETKR
jgi:aminopeptidase N